jgi:hypothetical protein
VKIRHYGLLANRGRDGRIERSRQLIGETTPEASAPAARETPAEEKPAEEKPAKPQLTCENCGSTRMRLLAVIQPVSRAWNQGTKIDSS